MEGSNIISQTFVFDDIINICINDFDSFMLFKLFAGVTNLRENEYDKSSS